MASFMVSAPGKVILHGEHAAVYNHPALAASISLRSYLLVSPHTSSLPRARCPQAPCSQIPGGPDSHTVRLNLRDIGLDHTWEVGSLPWNLSGDVGSSGKRHEALTRLDGRLYAAVQVHAEAVSPVLHEAKRQAHLRSAAAFLYLYLSLASPETPGATYTLRSVIPTGAGLGSSASVCVCLSTALLLQSGAMSPPGRDQSAEQAEVQTERISRWAFLGELCIHGEASGVDNALSTRGGAAVYQRNDEGIPSVTPLPDFPRLPLLLVDTGHPRSTAVQVAKVSALRTRQPALTDAILDGIAEATASALEGISTPSGDDALESMGLLMRANHGLLSSLGVSHPLLERVREMVEGEGGWAKMTGAGGGGCAVALVPGGDPETMGRLTRGLAREGCGSYEVVVGGEGVGVRWPAVVRGGGGGEGEREVVTLEMFEGAVGDGGLEELAG